MRAIHRLIFTGTLLIQAGCNTMPQNGQQDESAAEAPSETPVSVTLPKVELTPRLMYQLLTAEFAAQSGALRLSANIYLQTAEETRDPRLAQRATHVAIYARDVDIALTAAQLWVELSPANVEAHQSAAALLISSERSEEAIPNLRKIMEIGAANPGQTYLQVANLLSSDADKKRALGIMDQLLGEQRNKPDALYAKAFLAYQLNDNEIAEKIIQNLLDKHPKFTQARLLQATVLHSMGKGEAAIESLHLAVEQEPDNNRLRLTYARMLIDARHLAEARKEFQIINRNLPNDTDVIYALGLLALEAGDTKDAASHFKKLVNNGGHEEEARFALGKIAEGRDQPEEALEWYRSVPMGERYMDAQLHAARLIAKQKGTDAALAYLHDLPLSEPSDQIQRYLAEGELLSSEERYDEAIALYDEGLVLFIDNTQLLYARALTAEKADRLDILERDLKRILQKDPDNTQALNALGYTLTDRTDRHQEALKYIKQALKQEPDDPAILDSMGWVLYHLGRLDEAQQYLERAASKLKDGEVAAHLGEVLWAKGKKEEAKLIWNDALKFAPDNKILQQTIERFTQ